MPIACAIGYLPSAPFLAQFADNSAGGFSIFGEEVADGLVPDRTLSAEKLGSAKAGGGKPSGNSLRIRALRGRTLTVVNGNMRSDRAACRQTC